MKKRKHAEHLLDILGDLDERYLKEAESALEKMPVKQSIEEQKRKEFKEKYDFNLDDDNEED